MPEYDLYLLCAECGSFHQVPIPVSLEESFETRLVRDVYDGEISLEVHEAICDYEFAITSALQPVRRCDDRIRVRWSWSKW